MALKYFKFDRPIKEIPAAEISWLRDEMISKIMRTIILNERDFLSVTYQRALRGFWYTTVKPVLDKLGLLTEKDSEEDKLKRWDSELSRYMGELVKEGELSYQDLNILDTSRQRETPSERYMITDVGSYGYKVQVAPYANIIICVEKDTAYNIVSGLASFLGCSCISGKGQNALAAMEDLLRGIKDSESSREPIYILTLTDYDPYGYYIASTFRQQAGELQRALNMDNPVQLKRIGITPGQLTAEEVENNKYTPKKSNRDKWFHLTGGINGEPKGLELDALPPERIRGIFIENVRPYIDPEKYRDFAKEAYLKKLVLDTLSLKVNQIADDIISSHLNDVELSDFDMWDFAQQGYTSIPIGEICSTQSPREIERKISGWFK